MSLLFDPLALRSLVLRNRIAVSPMCQYSAIDGVVQPWHLMHVGSIAKSNPGILIMEATAVSEQGRISTGCTGLWNDAQAVAAAKMLRDIRTFSSTPIGVQLSHAGRKGSTRKVWAHRRASSPLDPSDGGWAVVGPSANPFDVDWPKPDALDEKGLTATKGDWVEAALRADGAGFDLVEIHAAHGYLLSSFFSNLSNQRSDRYGGSLENRMRYPVEVVSAVRAAWPAHKPLGVRINGSDWCENGATEEDAVIFAAALRDAGVDYVTTSAGNVVPDTQHPPLEPGYMAHFAERVRHETGLLTMAVGLIVDPAFAEALLARGTADIVAIGRAFLDNPNWTYHAAQALGAQHPRERAYNLAIPRNWPGYALAHPAPGSDNHWEVRTDVR